jgi:hypothetical protein
VTHFNSPRERIPIEEKLMTTSSILELDSESQHDAPIFEDQCQEWQEVDVQSSINIIASIPAAIPWTPE